MIFLKEIWKLNCDTYTGVLVQFLGSDLLFTENNPILSDQKSFQVHVLLFDFYSHTMV